MPKPLRVKSTTKTPANERAGQHKPSLRTLTKRIAAKAKREGRGR